MNELLSSILGQKRVVETLQRFIKSNQVPHAMLFSGPKNVGQHQTAKFLISELLAAKVPKKDYTHQIARLEMPVVKYVLPLPRGKSETGDDAPLAKLSKTELEVIQEELDKKTTNPFYEIFLENANSIKISSIRDIKRNLSLNYDELPNRVIIIEEAHLMGVEAQNALLKSLEEPPEGVIFILISDKSEMLLTTIKSRCWELSFAPLEPNDIEHILVNNFNIEIDLAQKVIPFADGSIHKVFELLNFGFEKLLDVSVDILRYSLGKRYNTAIKLFSTTIEDNPKMVFPILIQLFVTWFNDVQKVRVGKDDISFINHTDTINKFVANFSFVELDEIIFELTTLQKNIDYNINLNLLILNIIFSLSSIVQR